MDLQSAIPPQSPGTGRQEMHSRVLHATAKLGRAQRLAYQSSLDRDMLGRGECTAGTRAHASTPTGSHSPAQGNALGTGPPTIVKSPNAAKQRRRAASIVPPFQGWVVLIVYVSRALPWADESHHVVAKQRGATSTRNLPEAFMHAALVVNRAGVRSGVTRIVDGKMPPACSAEFHDGKLPGEGCPQPFVSPLARRATADNG